MYFVIVMFSAHRSTVPRSIASTGEARRTTRTLASVRVAAMAEPTVADIDALVGPATPHFAYQLRARVRELVRDLPEEHPVRRYAEEKAEFLDRLGYASSKAADGGREPRSRPGWTELPSTAPVDEPLPHRR
jgi:hypothetical protein